MGRGGATRAIILAAVLLAFCAQAANAQSTGEPCQTRSLPVGVSIEESTDSRENSETYLGLLAYFGSNIAEGPMGAGNPMSLVVASDRYACHTIADATGKVVMVWRGTCSFIEKALNAQAANAAAVIVVTDDEELSPMSCAGNSSVTIPAIQVLEADGNAMEKDVEEGIVEVSFTEISMKGSVDLVASMALLAICLLYTSDAADE